MAKLDRLSRSLIDFAGLVRWCKDNGKVLVCLEPRLDFSTPQGRAFANVLMSFAEYERELIGQRIADSRRKIRVNGWHPGGQSVPYGYRSVKVGDHYELTVHDEQAGVVRELAGMIISGTSIRATCKSLNDRGVKSAKGGQWDVTTVARLLRNPARITHRSWPR